MNEIEAYKNLKNWLFGSYNEQLRNYLILKALNDFPSFHDKFCQEKSSSLCALYALQDLIEKAELKHEWYAWRDKHYKIMESMGDLDKINRECLAWRFEYMENEYPEAFEYPEFDEAY